ncbi:MAG: hypothetical protein JHC40_18775 [Burkholderiales bacterium]|jgi:hypothetical protein|nr:hypothetical protein [Burkholderiales bacterium]
MTPFTESVVKQAALARLQTAGWQLRNGAAIALSEPTTERDDYGQVVPAQRLRDSFLPLVAGDLRIMPAEKFVGRTV